jgi:hypothetical protein
MHNVNCLCSTLRMDTRYREMSRNTPLPPQPLVTRWGTWLEAASIRLKLVEAPTEANTNTKIRQESRARQFQTNQLTKHPRETDRKNNTNQIQQTRQTLKLRAISHWDAMEASPWFLLASAVFQRSCQGSHQIKRQENAPNSTVSK